MPHSIETSFDQPKMIINKLKLPQSNNHYIKPNNKPVPSINN